jgi:hypothetical protein
MKHAYFIFFTLVLIACNSSDPKKISKGLKGVYKLISLQSQEDTIFKPMEGVEIIKIFTDSQWISPAYLNRNSKVVNLAGGKYTYKDGMLFETVLYHSKDTVNIGLTSVYKVTLRNDTLYQSGFFKPGTPDHWKVEEYWKKIE